MIANKYQIQQQLGKGSFGEVYQGLYVSKKETVAIKIETTHIKMLKHESTLLNYLYQQGSRKTPFVYWFGKYNAYPTLVMSYYTHSLEDWFQQQAKQISAEMARTWIRQILDIVQTIHRCFVIHRDIKPQNFMFKGTELFLIDFGLAAIYVDENQDPIPIKQHNHVILGTPKYVSFYVHDGWDPACRDDLISVAYIWVYLLYGRLPWENILDTSENEYDESCVLHSKNQTRRQMKSVEAIQTFLGQYPREGSESLLSMLIKLYI